MTRTILVVEDDEDLRVIMCEALTESGRIVLEAEHGLAALKLIEARGLPDLMLLDMNMPVMNDWKLAEELRARGLWRIPVIVITAAHDVVRCAEEIGAISCLGKPFSVGALSTLVQNHLSRSEDT